MATADLQGVLNDARRELLDLSARNRLISTPRGRSRTTAVNIVGESAVEVLRRLVVEKRSLTFLPTREAPAEADLRTAANPSTVANIPTAADLPTATDLPTNGATPLRDDAPEPIAEDAPSIQARQTDNRLQTNLSAEALQKRLLKLFYDARTAEEEQGVNILYLAIGFLRWYEAPSSNVERFAPLLLVPVTLERETVRSRFKLSCLDDEVTTNLSLQAKLAHEFRVKLPEVPELDELDPEDYFRRVTEAIADQPRWEVRPNDQVLWLFSFAKFLMYRDLLPETWPAEQPLEQHPLTRGLLCDGFAHDPPLCGDDEHVDWLLPAVDLTHVVDADSSQAVAIEEIRLGRNMVVQGPPGTGKSQTIVNMIAAAVKRGKTVLFVSEKMAALEVVKQRLDRVGLGPLCLELHSHKARKQQVLAELKQTLELTRPKLSGLKQAVEGLGRARDRLNGHASALHQPIGDTGITPYEALGGLVRLRAAGVAPVDFSLEESLRWSSADRAGRKALLKDLLLHLDEVGVPGDHPWRGVQATAMLPTDIERFMVRLAPAIERWQRVSAAASELAEMISVSGPLSPQSALELARLARWICKAPPLDSAAIADTVWSNRRGAIDELIATGGRLADCRHRLADVVAGVAWETDVAAARRGLAAHGRSWFRLLSGDYRRAMNTLRGILRDVVPATYEQRLAILDCLIEGQTAAARLAPGSEGDALGRVAFGAKWQGTDSDWDALREIQRWEQEGRESKLPDRFRQDVARVADVARCQHLTKTIVNDLKAAYDDLKDMIAELRLDCARAFGVADIREAPLAAILDRLRQWSASAESLPGWMAYFRRQQIAEQAGLGEFTRRLDDGVLASHAGLDSFELAVHESVIREAFRQCPALAEFDGKSHGQVVEEFRRLDLRRIELARAEVALAHHERIPTGSSGIGELGVLKWEMEKQRRHKPIRQLLREAGHAVQQIKPVFMMSPISIAQYLQPGILGFDLLLIDEASQVRPVDALGAVARSRQVVVVGDDKQLPPTRFFSKMIDDDEDSEEGASQDRAGDLESILGLCSSRGFPQRMLRWHYRSHHHSLIAVSNREFYDNRLYVVPSADRAMANQGLCFHHVPHGIFDRGGTATNREEARAVARAVIEHVRRHPEQSLGVGAFSIRQRDAIQDELELLRRENDDLEWFFMPGKPDPFFVKNLENIQGDERDVIFISVGYGRDESGFMSMSFGPLSIEGGERRLNVLISRARQRCEVFSSITDDDIDLVRAKSRGAAAFKTFLRYARLGQMDIGVASDREFDSEFEAEVAASLSRLGYQVDSQVGVAGFFVDLGVYDQAQPGRYLLGIECDGAAYHASRSARDRDRLRQQVLEDRGWNIHRIWSTDWFRDPRGQLAKVVEAIDRARSGRETPSPASQAHAPLERDEPSGDDGTEDPEIARPYEEAFISLPEAPSLLELPRKELAKIAREIVKVESPIHQDEIARRMASFFGLKRTGARIVAAVQTALQEAVRRNWVEVEDAFYHLPGMADAPVRNREGVLSTSLRKPDMLPPREVRSALVHVIRSHIGAEADEAVVQTVRLLGFKATSGQLRQVVLQEVERLLASGQLCARNDKLYAPDA